MDDARVHWNLDDLASFLRVAEEGSLTAAARGLGLSLPAVSRRLSRLEAELGVRLFHRTTRSLALTDEGARLAERAARVLADLGAAEREARASRDMVGGRLRITSTAAFGRRMLARLLADFAARHPALDIVLDATDAVVDLVEAGYDLAVRFGSLPDSSLVARQLAPNRRVICAAPAYLARAGTPLLAADVARHDCITFGAPPQRHWPLAGGRGIAVRGRFACADGETAHALALAGAGLVMKSVWDVADDITAGRLVVVLGDIELPAAPISAVFPPGGPPMPSVRVCVDYLARELAEAARHLPL